MNSAYSVRHSLQGVLQDFIRAAGFHCVKTEELVRELVCQVAAYREEGTPLYPEIYVTSVLGALNSLAPGGERLVFGHGECGADIVAGILKASASLAFRGWSVYVAKTDPERVEYGLFRSLRYSIATSAEESMKDLGTANPSLLIRNRGHLVVEVGDSLGQTLTVSLTPAPASSSRLSEDVGNFAAVLTAGTSRESENGYRAYIERLLMDILQRCHGTLFAAIDPTKNAHPDSLADGVWIAPAVSLVARHAIAVSSKSAETLSDLQAAEVLLEGMANSDGIVVFGTDGTLLAFRVFLRPTEAERGELPETGGGRRRTFELMKMRVGKILEAAFFRSQDGTTLCSRMER